TTTKPLPTYQLAYVRGRRFSPEYALSLGSGSSTMRYGEPEGVRSDRRTSRFAAMLAWLGSLESSSTLATITSSAANLTMVSMWPSVWSPSSPSSSHTTSLAPSQRDRSASRSPSVMPALRVGVRRQERVVMQTPRQLNSREPPSIIASTG